ncbi:response regulator transcription factor [Streptomyces gelaticus]|uniref:response regulator transcription factor n=1 Tax=Streptomyces gelaticus TaxID=285446 RepID=UPI00379DA22E
MLIGGAAGNRAIARRLGIAERTVKAHLSSIMGKVGVSSRLEAALFAYAHHELICPAGQCPLGHLPKVQ